MNLQNNTWTPSEINSCEKTFNCYMVGMNGGPLYKIEAFRDSKLVASLQSENFFELKITNVNQVGVYPIDGIFSDFDSYARFTINDGNGKKVYDNSVDTNLFTVEILEFFPDKNTTVIGMRGLFKGVLFNKSNPLDSISIENGEFTFHKINYNNFNQCKE